MRDDFSESTKKLLAERAGHVCSNPDCACRTIGASNADLTLSVKIGEAAHICAASDGGSRFDPSQPHEERKSLENGIWLCASCATLIDKNDGADFPIQRLQNWKQQREKQSHDELSGQLSGILKLQRRIEGVQTGGDTFCYVMLYHFDLSLNIARQFVLIRNGEFPLYDVRFRKK